MYDKASTGETIKRKKVKVNMQEFENWRCHIEIIQ